MRIYEPFIQWLIHKDTSKRIDLYSNVPNKIPISWLHLVDEVWWDYIIDGWNASTTYTPVPMNRKLTLTMNGQDYEFLVNKI